MPTSDAMQVLTAAVTPVVLVSATAILISGTNARYISISDRIRALAHEYREPNCTVHLENLISQRNQPVSSKEVGTLRERYQRYQRAQQTAFEFRTLRGQIRPHLPRSIFQLQNRRNPFRCQAMTVAGLTINRADFHFAQM